MTAKLATVGLNAEELILLNSLLAILAIQKQVSWVLVEPAQADVYLVNSDSPKGAIFIRQQGHKVAIIEYSHAEIKPKQFAPQKTVVHKPMRARDLLTALERHSTSTSTSRSTTSTSTAASSPLGWLKRFA
ncbi:MAG: hypothetical protein U5M23_05040 [Marinagarivorans sp.]|nr:hypothetical protein [Marinagarivorans sp.]